MLYDRRELSGQRSSHPAQVLDLKQEFSSPLKLIDRYLLINVKPQLQILHLNLVSY